MDDLNLAFLGAFVGEGDSNGGDGGPSGARSGSAIPREATASSAAKAEGGQRAGKARGSTVIDGKGARPAALRRGSTRRGSGKSTAGGGRDLRSPTGVKLPRTLSGDRVPPTPENLGPRLASTASAEGGVGGTGAAQGVGGPQRKGSVGGGGGGGDDDNDDNDDWDEDWDDENEAALLREAWLIHPDAAGKMGWDISLSLVIMYSVITITYQIGFGVEFVGSLAVLDRCVDVTFALDILVAFNTSDRNADGHLEASRAAIAKAYLKGWFAIDFVSTVPLDMIMAAVAGGGSNTAVLRSVKLIRAIRLVRLFKIGRIIQKSGFFDKVENGLGLHPAVLKVLKLFLIMGFFAHLFACIMYSVSACGSDASDAGGGGGASEGTCWVDSYCVGRGAWFDDDGGGDGEEEGPLCLSAQPKNAQYLASLYWAFTTMTTIGYGDITPGARSTREVLTTTAIEVVGTTIFAYVVGALVGIIVNLSPGPKLRKQNLTFLNQYLGDIPCRYAFRRSLRLHFLQRLTVRSVFNEGEMLGHMAPELRIAVAHDVHGALVLRPVATLCALETTMRGAFTVLLPRLKPYVEPL